MSSANFWTNKNSAQAAVREYERLKIELAGAGKYDKGNAVMTIFSGAGGDDAEDFSAMLLDMYLKYTRRENLDVKILHENKNDHGGYRNVTLEIIGKTPTVRSRMNRVCIGSSASLPLTPRNFATPRFQWLK